MRRALRRSWPALTRFYGIKPWETPLFAPEELDEYVRVLAELQREMERQQRKARGARRAR